jgi:hypothetical protein
LSVCPERFMLFRLRNKIIIFLKPNIYISLHGLAFFHNLAARYFTIYFFLILICEAIGTAATPGLLCQPRVIVKMIVEKQMQCIDRGNRSSRIKRAPAPLLSISKSHMTRPGFEPGPPRWEAGD